MRAKAPAAERATEGTLEVDGAAAGTRAAGSLRSRALRGAGWTTAQMLLSRALRLASNLILTRMLFPEAFGLMALVNVFQAGMQRLSDTGVVPSVVRSARGDDPVFLQTAWTVQVGRGAVLWALCVGFAAPLARFYEQPELALLVPVASIGLLLAGLQSMELSLYRRHLTLGKLTGLEIGAQVLSIAVMVSWAWFQKSVWALVAGSIASAGFKTLLSYWLGGREGRYGFRWDREAAAELLHFGKWIFLSSTLSFLSGNLDRFIFGKTIPIGMLGVYSVGLTLALLPSDLIARLGNLVVFPALSRKLDAGGGLSSAFRDSRTPLLALASFVAVVLIGCGPPLIELLYDDRYHAAGWIVQILAVGAWFRALEVPAGSALLALGHARPVAAGHAAKVAGICVFVPIGFSLHGFPGALVAIAGTQLALYGVVSGAAARCGLRAIGEDIQWTAFVAVAGGLTAQVSAGVAEGESSEALRLVMALGTALVLWALGAYATLRLQGQRPVALLRARTVR